jgi:hypothetical protein
MQVSVEITSGLGRRLTIGVPAERVRGGSGGATGEGSKVGAAEGVPSGQGATEGRAAAVRARGCARKFWARS